MFAARTTSRLVVGFFLGIVVIVSLGGVADGQDVTLEDLDQLGRQAWQRGNWGEAGQYYRLALELAETRKTSTRDLVVILGNLAEMLRSSRQYDEAERFFDRAVAILRTGSTGDKRHLPVILGNQGRLYQETRRYALAESLLKESLRLTERQLGPQDPNVAQVLNSLGLLYTSINKRKEAEDNFKKAISLEEKLGVQDGFVAAILGNLAGLYLSDRRWSRAEPILLRALLIAKTSFGAEHPETAIILSKLGLSYYGQRKFVEAEKTFRGALEVVRSKPFWPDHVTVATISIGLARVLTEQGNYDEAQQRYTEALQVQEKNLGPKASEVATTLDDFVKLLRKMKSNAQAVDMEARAKSIRAEMAYTVKVRKGTRE